VSDYPFIVQFSIKPANGAIRTCVKGFTSGSSTEGSCVHVKKGYLLSFEAHSNFRTEEKYRLTDKIISAAVLAKEEHLRKEGLSLTSSDCAKFCLDSSDCNAFLYVIKSGESAPTTDSCILLTMPSDFIYPDNLIPVDGMIQVSDFYVREMTGNNTGSGNQIATGEGGSSSANQKKITWFSFSSPLALFAAFILLFF